METGLTKRVIVQAFAPVGALHGHAQEGAKSQTCFHLLSIYRTDTDLFQYETHTNMKGKSSRLKHDSNAVTLLWVDGWTGLESENHFRPRASWRITAAIKRLPWKQI